MKAPFSIPATVLIAVLVLAPFAARAEASPAPQPPPNRPPLIGITSLVADDYAAAILKAGGVPVVLPNAPGNDQSVSEYLKILDGLLMPGGADIPPSEYSEVPHETVEPLDANRHAFEKALVKSWIEQTRKPLLGICLGSQWINVAMGGSLVQDIPSAIGTVHRDTSHPVTLEADSRLASVLGADRLEVNSSHHQAVKRLGAGLRIVAVAPDGVVEAVETTDPGRFLIGVQWHPERMAGDPLQAALFKAFVEAARSSALRSSAE